MLGKLFNYVIDKGKISSKINILNVFSKKDKVYTKKIDVPGDKIMLNGCKVKSISLTSLNEEFSDVNHYDLRVNMKNGFGMWVNIYAQSLPDAYLEMICKKLGI